MLSLKTLAATNFLSLFETEMFFFSKKIKPISLPAKRVLEKLKGKNPSTKPVDLF